MTRKYVYVDIEKGASERILEDYKSLTSFCKESKTCSYVTLHKALSDGMITTNTLHRIAVALGARGIYYFTGQENETAYPDILIALSESNVSRFNEIMQKTSQTDELIEKIDSDILGRPEPVKKANEVVKILKDVYANIDEAETILASLEKRLRNLKRKARMLERRCSD